MSQYAICGYKVNALDFIVKPLEYFDFSLEMNKVHKIIMQNETQFLQITSDGISSRLVQKDIRYIEIVNHNIVIHSQDKTYTYRGSLKDEEEKLNPNMFSRCNNCYIVNLHYVWQVNADLITLNSGETIAISRPRKKEFMKKLTNYFAGIARRGD